MSDALWWSRHSPTIGERQSIAVPVFLHQLPMESTAKKTVSAPGKLLFAGGYLVLESPNIGVIIAVNKRFYCTTELFAGEAELLQVNVESPQFGQSWKYVFNKQLRHLQRDVTQSQNIFVERTLRVSLLALLDEERLKTVSRIQLTLKGDNDFYSLLPHLNERGEPKTLSAAMSLPPFLPAAKVDGKVLKSGLGSSACLVTSITASLWCSLKDAVDIKTDVNTIFRLAQIAHCHAQGKVGSGFDVAAACYGTHIYERFPKSLLADLLALLEDETTPTEKVKTTIQSILRAEWKGGIRASLTLPSFVQVMLADVSGGSESPSMARKVLAWKKTYESGSIPHWDDLIQINEKIANILRTLSSTSVAQLRLESFIGSNQDEWAQDDIGRLLLDLRTTAQESRKHLKAMGEAAGVPIEPDEQTELVDATIEVPGVIAALVPGAGGYDAVACVYINHPKVQQAVADLWCSWTKASVCPLTVQAALEGEGLRIEPPIESS